MFSAGNVTEKLRVAGFDCRGETVVDLYAGNKRQHEFQCVRQPYVCSVHAIFLVFLKSFIPGLEIGVGFLQSGKILKSIEFKCFQDRMCIEKKNRSIEKLACFQSLLSTPRTTKRLYQSIIPVAQHLSVHSSFSFCWFNFLMFDVICWDSLNGKLFINWLFIGMSRLLV